MLIALVAAVAAGPAVGVESPIAHPERDHAGAGLAERHFGLVPWVRPAGLPGHDVSSWQGNVDWAAVAAAGARFAFVKATEGTSYVNPYFAQQFGGAYAFGLVRGPYHFALPDRSTGAAQAAWFATHGGAWSADNQTLPGALDIEYNPYGATCYGLSQAAMVSWLSAFVNEYFARTGRWAIIYTTTNWWQHCTGNYPGFGATSPLWIARWSSEVGPLPAGWSTYAFWQWTNQPVEFPGDQDVFNGTQEDSRGAREQRPSSATPASAATTPATTAASATSAATTAAAARAVPRAARDRASPVGGPQPDPPGELLGRPGPARTRPRAVGRTHRGAEPASRLTTASRRPGQSGGRAAVAGRRWAKITPARQSAPPTNASAGGVSASRSQARRIAIGGTR